MQIAIEALITRLHKLRLAGGRNNFDHHPGFVLRALKELHIAYDAAG